MVFEGLRLDVFEAYAPAKWSSNVHNLARMKAKDTLLSVASEAGAHLHDELVGLSRGASDEIPNISNQKKVDKQCIYWIRDLEAREELQTFQKELKLDSSALLHLAVHDRHAALALVADHNALWVELRVPPGATVDRRNLASKLATSWQRERLVELLSTLPPEATLTFADDPMGVRDVDDAALARFAEYLENEDAPWLLAQRIEAGDAVDLGTDLPDHVQRWLGAFAPLFRFSAWSRDNDHIEATRKIQEDKAQKRKQATSYRAGDEVRIISGLFSGKVGVVESTDTKAQVKVRIGLMSIVVSGTALLAR